MASLGEMAAGLAHELNNPAAAARRSPRMAEASMSSAPRSGASSRRESTGPRPRGWWPCSARPWPAPEPRGRRCPGCRRCGGRASRPAGGPRRPEPWRVAEPLAAAGVDAEWLERLHALAGPATDAAVAWVAATLTVRRPGRGAPGLDRPPVDARRRRQELLLHGPRRGGRGRPARGPGDDADRARPQAQAHDDRGPPRLRPRPADAHGPRVRAQPGLDQPARQRDRCPGRQGHDHDHTRRDGDRVLVDVADDGTGIAPGSASACSTPS